MRKVTGSRSSILLLLGEEGSFVRVGKGLRLPRGIDRRLGKEVRNDRAKSTVADMFRVDV
jgi:hypothetical protein